MDQKSTPNPEPKIWRPEWRLDLPMEAIGLTYDDGAIVMLRKDENDEWQPTTHWPWIVVQCIPLWLERDVVIIDHYMEGSNEQSNRPFPAFGLIDS